MQSSTPCWGCGLWCQGGPEHSDPSFAWQGDVNAAVANAWQMSSFFAFWLYGPRAWRNQASSGHYTETTKKEAEELYPRRHRYSSQKEWTRCPCRDTSTGERSRDTSTCGCMYGRAHYFSWVRQHGGSNASRRRDRRRSTFWSNEHSSMKMEISTATHPSAHGSIIWAEWSDDIGKTWTYQYWANAVSSECQRDTCTYWRLCGTFTKDCANIDEGTCRPIAGRQGLGTWKTSMQVAMSP